MIDVNDFDETLPGMGMELKRLAASFAIGPGATADFTQTVTRDAILTTSHSCSEAIRQFATMQNDLLCTRASTSRR